MKKTLALLAALALTTAGTTFAQTAAPAPAQAHHGKGDHHKTPAQKADKMAKELGLTTDQKTKVEQLLATRQQEGDALKAKFGTDKKAGHAEMKAAHDRYEAQLKTILTPAQYAKLDKMKGEHHGHGKMDGGKTKVKTKA